KGRYSMASMSRARTSLYYLAGYLLPTGAGLLLAPQLVFQWLFSRGAYDNTMPRVVGALLIVLGILVVQIIRHRIDSLYPSVVGARIFLVGALLSFYLQTHDPFFLLVTGVVSIGLLWTAGAYALDRRA